MSPTPLALYRCMKTDHYSRQINDDGALLHQPLVDADLESDSATEPACVIGSVPSPLVLILFLSKI